MTYETGKVNFTGGYSSKAIVFDGVYTVTPTVVATHWSTVNPDLNVYVSDLSKLGCTLNLSDVPATITTVNYKILGK
jgi:hypothetical protein